MKLFNKSLIILFTTTSSAIFSNSINKSNSLTFTENNFTQQVIPDSLKWSERMALSIMKRNPEAWNIDHLAAPKWEYKVGLVLKSFENLYHTTKKEVYFNYIKNFVDTFVDNNGTIKGYDLDSYNIDLINSGKLLFNLYNTTQESKYLNALKTLRKQLDGQPRTPSGGFWHKKIYPNQMWLDGLYMGEPFYAQYTTTYENGKYLKDIMLQFQLLHEHAFDQNTGLYFHAWDESKMMPWSNKKTGTAPNIWLRALGWYSMALVDVLDFMPKDDPNHKLLVQYLNELAQASIRFQDKSGLWYQVPNLPNKEGNYLEASGSAMLIYSFAKGASKAYLPQEYKNIASKGFDGLIKECITVDLDGEVHIHRICKSAGLGGDPYRDGSYEYYLSEPIVTDNSHGLGPFILAAIELNK